VGRSVLRLADEAAGAAAAGLLHARAELARRELTAVPEMSTPARARRRRGAGLAALTARRKEQESEAESKDAYETEIDRGAHRAQRSRVGAESRRQRGTRRRSLANYYERSIYRVVPPPDAATELGPLEMQVLGLLDLDGGSGASKAHGPGASVTEIQARLRAEGHELAYTTVMTVLGRLHQKGLATRHKVGNRFLYLASRKSPDVKDGLLTRLHRALFQGDRTKPILALLDDEELSRDELKALRRAIDERLGSTKK
jgi:predicted transcriptional regulator